MRVQKARQRVEEVSEEMEVEASGVVEESSAVEDGILNLDCVNEGGKMRN